MSAILAGTCCDMKLAIGKEKKKRGLCKTYRLRGGLVWWLRRFFYESSTYITTFINTTITGLLDCRRRGVANRINNGTAGGWNDYRSGVQTSRSRADELCVQIRITNMAKVDFRQERVIFFAKKTAYMLPLITLFTLNHHLLVVLVDFIANAADAVIYSGVSIYNQRRLMCSFPPVSGGYWRGRGPCVGELILYFKPTVLTTIGARRPLQIKIRLLI